MEESLSKTESSNITLRPISLSDVDDFMEWGSDERVARYCLWDRFTSKEEAKEYIKKEAIPHPWMRAICIENRAIGAIHVKVFDGVDRCRGELGYELGYGYWGKGIATRAVKMVVSTIFEDLPHLKRLQALTHVENKGSQRVLEKAGFQREGVLRKYALLKGKPTDGVMHSIVTNH